MPGQSMPYQPNMRNERPNQHYNQGNQQKYVRKDQNMGGMQYNQQR
jgi:hypothetical protein